MARIAELIEKHREYEVALREYEAIEAKNATIAAKDKELAAKEAFVRDEINRKRRAQAAKIWGEMQKNLKLATGVHLNLFL